jgi:hypothetical protein
MANLPSNFEAVRNMLNMERKSLMKKRHVVATGIGYKTVAGRTTKDLAIICSVDTKKAKSRLSDRDIIPALIHDVPTDVRPSGIIRAFQVPTGRFRPAPGGTSIGHYLITAGTLGCLVKKNNEIFILSNNHVLANSNEASIGDAILQPGPHDGGQNPQDQIAVLSEFVPIGFEEDDSDCGIAGSLVSLLNSLSEMVGSSTRLRPYRIQQTENKVDCAIAKPLNSNDVINEILQVGTLNGVQDGELGMNIKKSGRTTGFTTGTIEQVSVSAQVSYGTNRVALFTDQLLAGAMSQGGDSGSAVVNENNNLVGLLFAGSETTTIINRISHVFDALGVTLP